MVRVALVLIIAMSVLPFAATARRPTGALSEVRDAAVSPIARPEATATMVAPTAQPEVTATVTVTPRARSAASGAPADRTSEPAKNATETEMPSPGVPDSAPATTAPPATVTVTSQPVRTAIEFIIATRGDHSLRHDISLVPTLDDLSWARHGTEDNKTLPAGNDTVAPWLVVERDASQIDTPLDVRFNIRNIRCYSYERSVGTWIEIYSGLPSWTVSSHVSTADGYIAIAPVVEVDGSYSFEVPIGRALHMASGLWQPRLSESDGILSIVDARIIGPDADKARFAVAAGADFRSGDDVHTTNQSGFGHLGLLTLRWQSYTMLSSVLTDEEIRSSPPPFG